jgi:hypothetical protein
VITTYFLARSADRFMEEYFIYTNDDPGGHATFRLHEEMASIWDDRMQTLIATTHCPGTRDGRYGPSSFRSPLARHRILRRLLTDLHQDRRSRQLTIQRDEAQPPLFEYVHCATLEQAWRLAGVT